ncbi:MAG: citrate/2-methylcitrate synthase, partial [Acidobacteriota bacterium]
MPESLTAQSLTAQPVPAAPALHPGLEGVVLAETGISRVDGERGALTLAGYPLESIAPFATFEELTWLLQTGHRPSADESERLRAALAERRALPAPTSALLRHAAERDTTPMLALRQAAATFDLADDPTVDDLPFDAAGLTLLARMPIAVAAFERLRRGLDPVAPRNDLGHAASLLHGITGDAPSAERVRALNTYLCTVADHGCNAST